MEQKSFGEYLRFLRQSRSPSMTQEALGTAIGRGKMTISQFEKGKNAPPQGELLTRIIEALDLSSSEESMLIFLSAKARKAIPVDIEEYFFSNPDIYSAIRSDMSSEHKIDWKSLLCDKENSND